MKYRVFSTLPFLLASISDVLSVTQAEEELVSEIPLPEMVLIPGSIFQVGTLVSYHAQPIHELEAEPFYISKYEIAFKQLDVFTNSVGKAKRSDVGWGRASNPVIYVSWYDANEFAARLNKPTGEYYRLPTEAEWEYAAKAINTLSQYSWGDEPGAGFANRRNCGSQWDGKRIAPVGSFESNTEQVKAWYRASYIKDSVSSDVGFRLVRELN